MKKSTTISMLAIAAFTLMFLQSCKEDEEPEPAQNNEFVADDMSFAGWDS